MGRAGGLQVVSLGQGCVHHGVIVHEFMHAAGFWHEQSRYDRDKHVVINWKNIIGDMKYNFGKVSGSYFEIWGKEEERQKREWEDNVK